MYLKKEKNIEVKKEKLLLLWKIKNYYLNRYN